MARNIYATQGGFCLRPDFRLESLQNRPFVCQCAHSSKRGAWVMGVWACAAGAWQWLEACAMD
jgi:uncharacterized cupin superfamily protein